MENYKELLNVTLDEITNPIFLNIISSMLWVGLGFVSFKVFGFIRTRSNFFSRFFFNTKSHREPIILINATISKTISARKIHFLEEGDAKALNEVYGFVLEFRNKEKVKIMKHSDVVSEMKSYSNFITISGPIYNSVTEKYLEKSKCPFKFNRQNKSIDFEEQSFVSVYHPDKSVNVCYGMIVFGSSYTLKGKKQRFIILAGSSSVSTYTSTLILQRLSTDRKFRKIARKNVKHCGKNWGILFEVTNSKSKLPNDLFSDITLTYKLIKSIQFDD